MSGFLDHVADAPEIAVAALLGDRPLVVLAPHPDDETLGCGALLFDAAGAGTPCHVICVTDGARSHPGSRAWPAARLAQARQDELRAAVRILAPAASVTWLGHPDCGAPDDAGAAEAIARLVPQGALLLASWGDDPHIDHQQVARLAYRIAAARPDLALAFYPIWGRFTDLQAPALRIEATDAACDAKARALACHRTQMTALIDDDPEGFVMTKAHQSHFLTHPEIVIAP
ncbi:PIG-L family deacetylase [Paracoccus gahaiensis]|uniref:PIG-L family deacetylase n=1 Tax=Paracoccus gahaiensis TaxID=1706839 RepID=A0A4U0RSV1_9RHOB|nr:PIG-L deacetylase family protein [Paracoccus gahaiensis]TJZ91444.1 PIG-L family deacetylase [Paracoccus gahaiensis]